MKIFFTILFVYVCLVVQVASLTYFCDHSAPCGCSRNDAILNKIVGGEEAISSSWGWAVSLRDDGDNHICGGAIISPKYVVTAAHCVSDQNSLSTGMSVAVGMNRLSESDTVGQVRKVAEIIQHPRYDDSTHTNDIAVLRLNSSLDLSISASIVRLCLPRINVTSDIGKYPPDSTPLIAIGWGTLFFGSQNLPNQLQQVTVNEVPTNDFTCSIYNSQLQFCAGVNGGGKDTCQGDSGGPLMRFESAQRQWVLTGVTSFGKGCGDPRYAGVYTRVAVYTDWLKSIIGNDGLVEVEVGQEVVQPTIFTPITTTILSTTSPQTTTTKKAPVQTTSLSTNNNASLMIASYAFTFLFFLFAFQYYL